jgi:hypothetical protein
MKVVLTSPDVEIKPLSPEEQFVDDASPTSWEWDIRSNAVGRHQLRLAAIVKVLDAQKEWTALDREIVVTVNPYGSVARFFEANWQWLLTFIGGTGAIGALFRKLTKKRAEPPPWERV